VAHNKGQSGIVYPNFYCLGRQRDTDSCFQKVIPIAEAEEKVEELYRTVQLSAAWADDVRNYLREEFGTIQQEAQIESEFQERRIVELKDQQHKLIQLSYANAISLELLKSEQARINQELGHAEERLRAADVHFTTIETNLDRALSMVTNCHRAYTSASDLEKRHYNQTVFEWVKIGRNGITERQLADPFRTLLSEELAVHRATQHRGFCKPSKSSHRESGTHAPEDLSTTGVKSSKTVALVGEGGLEPPQGFPY
jgi:site-specific DNA recombinase